MRGFTEFCLCRIRAQSAPVSAHLSICRNFATVRGGDRASYPRCSHRRCQAANTRLYAHTATVQQHDCANARRRRIAVPCRIAKAAQQGFDVRTRIVQRSPRPGPENTHLSDARSQPTNSGQCPAHGRSAVCRSRKGSPLRSKRVSLQSPAQLPKNLTVTSAVSKIPNGVQYLCAAANSTVSHCCSPKNLTFLCEHRTANVEIRSRKGSPVQETGTVKRRFFPRQAGFPAISTAHHSRKASPMRNLCADRAPEKAHLQRLRPTVKRIPKKLTLWLSR